MGRWRVAVQLDVHRYSSGVELAEWVPYVLSARCAAEQNMAATLDHDGLLYFCVTRHVDAGAHLLVWYSEQLAHLLAVPELDNDCRLGRLSCNVEDVDFHLYSASSPELLMRCTH